ncbi:MAG: AtpZ/AtpI family protein [Proteobacteria bacterium]|nr:AtpZ/AtpI family protein [Pseudomonadota bacterium]
MAPHGRPSAIAALALYGAAGLALAASAVAGLVLGDYIDRRAGSGPWGAATGLVLGFAAGLANLIRTVRRMESGKGDHDGKGR